MSKKILAAIAIVAGLGLAAYFFLFPSGLVKPPSLSPPEQTLESTRPAAEPSRQPEAPAPQPAASPELVPPASGPGAPPETVSVPPPTPAAPPAEEEVAPSPVLEPKQRHGLLAGKFRRYADAQKLLEKIKKQKMPAFIRKEGKYYKVWVGPFPTPQEAERARKNLMAALKISSKRAKLAIPVAK